MMQLASDFMAAKHLFAANQLGLFEALADSPATLDALAARTGLTRRAARISADAMVALGLLEVQEGTDSVEEARGWLDRTGWRFTDHRVLAGPQSLIVAQAA
jgi:Dimerisation domain